jgi:hypothetical protein
MKKVILIVFMSLLSVTSFSQVFYNQSSNNLRYAGGLTPQVFEMLDTQERQMLFDCISECGVNKDSVVWIQKDVYDNLRDPRFYHTKVVVKTTSGQNSGSNVYDGFNTLEKPQFMVFIDRYNGETEIRLQMYY